MRTTQVQWQRERVAYFPPNIAGLLLERHSQLIGTQSADSTSPWYVANQWLVKHSKGLRLAQVARAFDDAQVCEYAENYSTRCRRLRPPPGCNDLREFAALKARLNLAESIGVTPRWTRGGTCASLAARLEDPHWWRRQLRRIWTRAAENSMRELGIVRKGREPYASDAAVNYRRTQRRRGMHHLQNREAVNELEQVIDLWEVTQGSVSNPAIRRGEFMTRVRGFEEIATELRHVPLFVTATAPSAFHAQLARGGRNPAWDNGAVRSAQEWLCKVWARVRARWKRQARLVYGFRIAEPHHDGTPHWHLLLFMRERDRKAIREDITRYWLQEFADESGARMARVKFEDIDPARGSATGYVAKYVSKNIDGTGAIGNAADDETDSLVVESVARVDAWASIHGIRQFQQIGGAPVGLWREARRIRQPTADIDIERARRCADRGRWAAFCRAVGGELLTRKTALRLVRTESGRCNRFGELRPPCIVGLSYASAIVYTRPHEWRIVKKGSGSRLRSSSSLGPVAITVRQRQNAGPSHVAESDSHRRGVQGVQPPAVNSLGSSTNHEGKNVHRGRMVPARTVLPDKTALRRSSESRPKGKPPAV